MAATNVTEGGARAGREAAAGRCRLAARLRGAPADGGPGLLGEGAGPAGPGGAPLVASLAFEHAALHLLAAGGGPQGSGTLMERLSDLGFRVSEPTVGRFLRALDRRGLTSRVSNKGRGLTEAGWRRLEQLCEADARLHDERALVRALRSATVDEVVDVLVARRALEGEAARLAAGRATAGDVARLEGALAEQRARRAGGGAAADAAGAFHALVAQAGRNRVLAAAIDLIRRDQQLALLLDAVLRRTTRKWVVGHERILAAIKRRAPDEAQRAMLDHIDAVIADVRKYHRQTRRKGGSGEVAGAAR
jgi:GntR family L-lactate dehydrogenase operon transcriptional regulator